MTNDSMIRGALPLAWFALIGSTVLLYSIAPSDPTWGDMIATLRQWYILLPVFVLLMLLTFFIGLPSMSELVAAMAAGIAGSVAIIILAAIAGPGHYGWLLIATFLLVIPLSALLFRQLMLGSVNNHN